MPNGEDKRLNFTMKVWDTTAKAYRPVYIAPDATDSVQGDVKLSDSVNSSLNAATGMTAATPAAVKTVADSANNKLDKVSSSDQTVVSQVTFQNVINGQKGVVIPSGQYLTGNVNGNASTATTLSNKRQFSVKIGNGDAGTATFNGGADASITIPQVDASAITTGTIPLSVLPQGALERLVKVANQNARFALTTDEVQLGDSVLQIDTNIMYIVIDSSKLNSEEGYQEYTAGTSVSAETANKVAHSLTVQKNGNTSFTYDGSVSKTLNIDTSFSDLNGQIAINQIPDSSITDAKVKFNYAGSDSKNGSAISAIKLANARTISFTGVVSGSSSFDGSQDVEFATSITDGGITESMLADNAVTSNKISNGAITNAKIVDGTITGAKIVNSTITGSKIASNTITSANIANSTITGSKIASNTIGSYNLMENSVTSSIIAGNAVTLANLATSVGTVAIGPYEPDDFHVQIWISSE